MDRNLQFKILAKDKKTKARVGEIKTPHGIIQTPAFIPVGTKATVKSLTNAQLEKIGVQCFFVNTYHLYLQPGENVVAKLGGLNQFIGWQNPLMTDSGGFQVFSQARNKNFGGFSAKVGEEETLCKINDEGVTFKSFKDGSVHHFTPEKSIEIQRKLGADIILCFDECTYYPAIHEYAKRAMERTHRWALRCLEEKLKVKSEKSKVKKSDLQALYGIVQGSTFEDLRKESAKFISKLPFEGVAIGGVSVGESKKEMVEVLNWVCPLLPEEKPRHLLGVGEIDDIFELVERGIDTFDCVMPTRMGRMGHILVKSEKSKVKSRAAGIASGDARQKWTIDITKAEFKEDKRPIEKDCRCLTCLNYSKAYLNHLFRSNELLGYTLASYHNLWFLERLMEEIRKSIIEGKFLELKKRWTGAG